MHSYSRCISLRCLRFTIFSARTTVFPRNKENSVNLCSWYICNGDSRVSNIFNILWLLLQSFCSAICDFTVRVCVHVSLIFFSSALGAFRYRLPHAYFRSMSSILFRRTAICRLWLYFCCDSGIHFRSSSLFLSLESDQLLFWIIRWTYLRWRCCIMSIAYMLLMMFVAYVI